VVKTPSRGFTLLEVVLATSMGVMVIVVALALMQSMERMEKPLAVRQQELADLHRARLVMQRALAGLVMSDTTAPVNPNTRRNSSQTTTSDEAAKSAFEASEEAFKSRNPRPPARLLLEPDTSAELRAMLVDVGLPADEAQKLQRLEIVIDSPPIAPQFRAELADALAQFQSQAQTQFGAENVASLQSSPNVSPTSAAQSPAAGAASDGPRAAPSGALSRNAAARSERASALRERFASATGSATGDNPQADGVRRDALSLLGKGDSAKQGALRGCFEIRPMLTADARALRAQGKPVMYELWWRPMPAAVETKRKASAQTASPTTNPAEPAATDPSAEGELETKVTDPRQLYAWGEPVLLADNLVKCNWKLYSEGQRRPAHHAVWEKELPAYVEFELQTRTGLYANWMFEIGWTKGPELASRAGGGPGGGAGGGPGGGPLQSQNPEARGGDVAGGGTPDSTGRGTTPPGIQPPTGTGSNGIDVIDIRKKP
jgi:hypothetical protein